jgi:hypothetical protein
MTRALPADQRSMPGSADSGLSSAAVRGFRATLKLVQLCDRGNADLIQKHLRALVLRELPLCSV